ncbi:MAG: YdiU family protein [Burkholderiales bacterium]|nr:YdiU family protein [Burkholderiales bacterium]
MRIPGVRDDFPRPAPAPGLCELRFENRFVDELPGDPERRNAPRPVRNACYTLVDPTPVRSPRLLAWADAAGELLGIARPASPEGPEAQVLSGSRVLPGMRPYAARYGGHQFGHWAGQLGDGRAITLAEVEAPDGSRHELQLKGAGVTPDSRSADGRAVLRSSVREYLCSEAMHWLGVPSTRALSLAATGEPVERDMFYDGNPQVEPGAVVCRVAPSFVRFGNFEILAAQEESELLRRLADFVIRTQFPALAGGGEVSPAARADWFEAVCRRTADMMVAWMRVGFVHGVMNTDNMSILGLTIDYGPYGWLEGYDLQWTPNTTDLPGRRYCYGNQPYIAQWNLARLANALYPLFEDTAPLEHGLRAFAQVFEQGSMRMLADKLGLSSIDREGDEALVRELFELLQASETDMTIFFRSLAGVPVQGEDAHLLGPMAGAFYDAHALGGAHGARLAGWLRRFGERARAQGLPDAERRARMNRVNPKYVLRNYLAQQAIDALAAGDASVLERLMRVLSRPYDEQPQHEDLAARRPEWARHRAGCSALSCSS